MEEEAGGPIPLDHPSMFYVYVLQSLTTEMYYVGFTSNLNRRIIEHNKGKNISTRNKGPYRVIYTEEFDDRLAAIKKERLIKSYKGGLAFKKLINPM